MKHINPVLMFVVVLFGNFYLAFEVIPYGNTPFLYWWDFPLMVVQVFSSACLLSDAIFYLVERD